MSNIEEITETTNLEEIKENSAEINDSDMINSDENEFEYEVEEVEEVVEVKTKKKFPLQAPVIVALCLVLGAVIVYFALSIFVPTIEGSWVMENEGVKTYFTFEQKGGNCTFSESIGTISVSGTYAITKSDQGDTLDMSFSSGSGLSCTYTVEGNRLFGECILTLIDTTGSQEIVLKAADKPEIDDYIKPYENFKTNEELLGEWSLDYGMGVPATLSFGEDGVISVDWFGTQTEVGYYTVDGTTVSRKIFSDKEYEDKLEFEITDKGLVFMQQLWTKVDPASVDQK